MKGEKPNGIRVSRNQIESPRRGRNFETNHIQNASLTTFSGPIPPPSLLSCYEEVCTGAADRIIKMAEREAEHRRTTETTIVCAGVDQAIRESSEAKRGQVFALTIVIASIAGCIFLAVNGHEISASALGLGGIGSIVTTFIVGRTGKKPARDVAAVKERAMHAGQAAGQDLHSA